MRLLLAMVVSMAMGSCVIDEQSANVSFAIEKDLNPEAEYYYMLYKFALSGYKTVDTAVKVETRSNKAVRLWVLDLSSYEGDASNVVLEEAALTGVVPAFTGRSPGSLGGTYTGSLDMNGNIATGCCGQMTFVPTADTGLTFVGTKVGEWSAHDWQHHTGQPVPGDGGDDELGGELGGGLQQGHGITGPLTPDNEDGNQWLNLGNMPVGKVFKINTSNNANVRRLEAHNSNGVVSKALARWKTTAGKDIFAVDALNNLFLTKKALNNNVDSVVGFDANGAQVLKVGVEVMQQEHGHVRVQGANLPVGAWVGFSDTPPPMEGEVDYASFAYLSLDASSKVHDFHKGNLNSVGNYSARRGYWVGISGFGCVLGAELMVKAYGHVYRGTCISN